jgi:hypothetical protein
MSYSNCRKRSVNLKMTFTICKRIRMNSMLKSRQKTGKYCTFKWPLEPNNRCTYRRNKSSKSKNKKFSFKTNNKLRKSSNPTLIKSNKSCPNTLMNSIPTINESTVISYPIYRPGSEEKNSLGHHEG